MNYINFLEKNNNKHTENINTISNSLALFYNEAKKDLSMALFLFLKDHKISMFGNKGKEKIHTLSIVTDDDYEVRNQIFVYANNNYCMNSSYDLLHYSADVNLSKKIIEIINKIIPMDLLYYFVDNNTEGIVINFDEQKILYEKNILNNEIIGQNNNQTIKYKI